MKRVRWSPVGVARVGPHVVVRVRFGVVSGSWEYDVMEYLSVVAEGRAESEAQAKRLGLMAAQRFVKVPLM